MVNWNIRTCNTTLDYETTDGEIKAYGSLTFHQLGLIIAAATGLFATILSFFLMFMHGTHYSRPNEQRHILRILFMIPIYSVVSFLSFYFYRHYVYYQVIRDCYDAFAIASFFTLLCNYIAPTLHDQKNYFRELQPKNWLLPVNWMQKCCGSQRKGPWRVPRSGLTWFNILWIFIFQYCLLRVVLTIVAVVTQHYGRYCVEGLSPAYFHVWNTVISAISVSLAMYCLIQFYYQVRLDIADHSPLLKILSIKLVIFFVFWQTIILGFLNDSGVIKASEKIADPDIIIGIPAILIDIEMALFAILHIFAYPWKPYDLKSNTLEAGATSDDRTYKGGPLGLFAYADAFNPWDIIKAIGRGFKWAFVGRKNREQDISYQKNIDSTPLQDNIPGKAGRYEQLDDEDAFAHEDVTHAHHSANTPYDAFHHQTVGVPTQAANTRPSDSEHPYYREDQQQGYDGRYQTVGYDAPTSNVDTSYHAPKSYTTYAQSQQPGQSHGGGGGGNSSYGQAM